MNVKNDLDEVKKSCSCWQFSILIQTWLFWLLILWNQNWNFESKKFWRNNKTFNLSWSGRHTLSLLVFNLSHYHCFDGKNCTDAQTSCERTIQNCHHLLRKQVRELKVSTKNIEYPSLLVRTKMNINRKHFKTSIWKSAGIVKANFECASISFKFAKSKWTPAKSMKQIAA